MCDGIPLYMLDLFFPNSCCFFHDLFWSEQDLMRALTAGQPSEGLWLAIMPQNALLHLFF